MISDFLFWLQEKMEKAKTETQKEVGCNKVEGVWAEARLWNFIHDKLKIADGFVDFFLQLIELLSSDNLHMFAMTMWCIWNCKYMRNFGMMWKPDPQYQFDCQMNICINGNKCVRSINAWQTIQVQASKLGQRKTVTTTWPGGENQPSVRLSATWMQ